MDKILKYRFRPMGFTDILDEIFDIYKKNFLLLFGISAVLYVPYFFLTTFIQMYEKAPVMNQNPSDMSGMYSSIIGFIWLGFIAGPITTAATTLAISELYLNKTITIVECYKRVLSLFSKLIRATFFQMLVIIVGFLLGAAVIAASSFAMKGNPLMVMGGVMLILLGVAIMCSVIYVALRWMLVTPALVLEQLPVFKAFDRSWKLIQGNVAKTVGLLFVVGLVSGFIQVILTMPTTALVFVSAMKNAQPNMAIITLHTFLSSISSAITAPISYMVIIFIYYDMRIRREGFDLEMLANDMGEKTRELTTGDITNLPTENNSDWKTPNGL